MFDQVGEAGSQMNISLFLKWPESTSSLEWLQEYQTRTQLHGLQNG